MAPATLKPLPGEHVVYHRQQILKQTPFIHAAFYHLMWEWIPFCPLCVAIHTRMRRIRFSRMAFVGVEQAIQRSLGKRAMIARLQRGPGAPYLRVGFLLRFCKSRTTGCRRQASGRSTLGDTWVLACESYSTGCASQRCPTEHGWMDVLGFPQKAQDPFLTKKESAKRTPWWQQLPP